MPLNYLPAGPPIQFYLTGQPYDIFSNVTDVGLKINLNGREYQARSSEAVYQGTKAIAHPQGRQLIEDRRAPGGFLQQAGREALFQNPNFANNAVFNPATGVTVKEEFMHDILMAKFTQNPPLLRALLETGNRQLIENAPTDHFWGIGTPGQPGYPGRNALGRTLERCRNELQAEYNAGQIQVRAGISDALAQRLGHGGHQNGSQLTAQFISQAELDATAASTTVADFHRQPQRGAAFIPMDDLEQEEIRLGADAGNNAQGFNPHPNRSFDIVPKFIEFMVGKGYVHDEEKKTLTKGDNKKPLITYQPAGANGIPKEKITFKDASMSDIRDIASSFKASLEAAHNERYRDANPPVPFDPSKHKVEVNVSSQKDLDNLKLAFQEVGIKCEGKVKEGKSAPGSKPSSPMPDLPGLGRRR